MTRVRYKLSICKIVIPLILAIFQMSGNGMAASHGDGDTKVINALADPHSALISPSGGRLQLRHEVPLHKTGEGYRVTIFVPNEAQNLQIDVPGFSIVRWTSTPVILKTESGHSTKRDALAQRNNELSARLETVKARLAVWQAQTQPATANEMTSRQAAMQEQMPKLGEEKDNLEKELAKIREELVQMPQNSGIGKQIDIILEGLTTGKQEATVDYSYDLSTCGWTPRYEFNANPDTSTGDIVDVRLLAEVWQYTGMDWHNTEITLATRGNGPREPKPLRKWVVGANEQKPQPKPEPRAMSRGAAKNSALHEAAPMVLSAKAADVAIAPQAPVTVDVNSVYASWKLSVKGLPEGESRLLITSNAWKAPLEWMSRPSTDDTTVWIMAKYKLPLDQAWPEGYAQYCLDGQNVGEGAFSPKGGEAILYFGSDPRIQVHTTIDSNKQGETGIINASKTWTGAWTYTFTNSHSIPIKIKVERPEPIVTDENITVTYKDNPKAQIDSKEHMIYWTIEVPANGKASIEHSITISSPVKLPLFPDVS